MVAEYPLRTKEAATPLQLAIPESAPSPVLPFRHLADHAARN
jgi:hypothetical protein